MAMTTTMKSAEAIMNTLASKFMTGPTVKLRMDDDVFDEVLTLYKAKKFNPKCPLKICYNG